MFNCTRPGKGRIVLILLVTLSAVACGRSVSHDIYERCVEQQAQKLMETAKMSGHANDDTATREMAKLAEASCKPIKAACDKDPDGPICRRLAEEFP